MSRRGTGYYPALQRELDDDRPMTAEQAETLKRLAKAAYELDAFKPNLTRAEADRRIAALSAKLKLLDGQPIHSEPWSQAAACRRSLRRRSPIFINEVKNDVHDGRAL